jgi:hypothetical protein
MNSRYGLCTLGHVGDGERSASAGLLNFSDHFGERLATPRQQANFAALGSERPRQCPPYPAGCPGDDRDLTRE